MAHQSPSQSVNGLRPTMPTAVRLSDCFLLFLFFRSKARVVLCCALLCSVVLLRRSLRIVYLICTHVLSLLSRNVTEKLNFIEMIGAIGTLAINNSHKSDLAINRVRLLAFNYFCLSRHRSESLMFKLN